MAINEPMNNDGKIIPNKWNKNANEKRARHRSIALVNVQCLLVDFRFILRGYQLRSIVFHHFASIYGCAMVRELNWNGIGFGSHPHISLIDNT